MGELIDVSTLMPLVPLPSAANVEGDRSYDRSAG